MEIRNDFVDDDIGDDESLESFENTLEYGDFDVLMEGKIEEIKEKEVPLDTGDSKKGGFGSPKKSLKP